MITVPPIWHGLVVFLCLTLLLSSCSASVEPFRVDGSLELDEDERRLWNRSRELAKKLDRSGQLYDSPELAVYLNQVAANLVPPELRRQDFVVTVKILKNPLLNAFALPHGAIYVHLGMLAKMENEAQLASVLGHELVHITHRHALQHFRTAQDTTTVMAAMQIVGIPFGIFGALANLLGAVGGAAAITGYSRAIESEADAIGIEMLVRAGYDPAEGSKLFEYLKAELEEQKQREPFFFGSHPKIAERRENWSVLLNERFPDVKGRVGSEAYAEKIAPALLEAARMDMSYGRWTWAEHALKRYITFKPQNAEGRFHMGELFRLRSDKGDDDNALKQYKAAAELDRSYAAAYRGMGSIYFKQGQIKEARRELNRYLSLAPDAMDRAYVEQYLKTMEGGTP